jgi:CRP-like cAMP-binding protein
MKDVVPILRRVEFLAPLDDDALRELAPRCREERFSAGARLVSELEFGADVLVILEGRAEISVEPREGEKQVLGVLEAGGAVGEMSSLTGELRSATVTALESTLALRIPDATFDELRERRPEVAVALVRVLARRIGEAERAIGELLVARPGEQPAAAKGKAARGSISRAFLEHVTSRGRDLGFLALAAFALTLVVVRLTVFAAFRFDFAPREVLRALYLTGFALLGTSAGASLLTFRPAWRRGIAVAYGIACALIANELGVTLAFDIFYKDIHTADPNVAFDVERLYRRTEPLRAIAIAFVVLVQLAYLRRFYRRAGFIVLTRLRKLVGRHG